jgi:Flp pilus assembly protein TadG
MKTKVFIKCQKGASAVEFAIVLPLLLAFVFGIIEFGILLYDKAVITNASREGARTAVLFHMNVSKESIPYPAGEVITMVQSYTSNRLINFSGATPSVTVSAVTPSAGVNYRTVTVTYGYSFLLLPNVLGTLWGVNSVTMPGTIPLSAATTMRMEDQDVT